tara:strand:- start:288 stop:1058 length:771 start_codon:yes stop_codon:yes gene_type:complete
MLSNEKTININKTKIYQFPRRLNFEGISKDIDDGNEFIKNCIHAQSKINLDNKHKIFKTHNAYWKNGNYSFTDLENTIGCIYIVRDPRNIITSIKNHYNFESYDESLEFLQNEKNIIGILNKVRQGNDLPTIISSWKNHYNSWKKLKTNYLLIKYEDILVNPKKEFLKIINFIKKISDIKLKNFKIENAISYCNFKNLQALEQKQGFVEAPKDKSGNSIKFFNLGSENQWQKLLCKQIIKKIETSFKEEMTELKYL